MERLMQEKDAHHVEVLQSSMGRSDEMHHEHFMQEIEAKEVHPSIAEGVNTLSTCDIS
jgi:hypothetical protein